MVLNHLLANILPRTLNRRVRPPPLLHHPRIDVPPPMVVVLETLFDDDHLPLVPCPFEPILQPLSAVLLISFNCLGDNIRIAAAGVNGRVLGLPRRGCVA